MLIGRLVNPFAKRDSHTKNTVITWYVYLGADLSKAI